MPSAMDSCMGGAEQMTCGVRDPHAYVTVEIGPTKRASTFITEHTAAPAWNEQFLILVADAVSEIGFSIKDETWIGAPVVAHMAIPVGRVVSGDVVEGWFDLKVFGPANRHGQAALKIRIQYEAVEADPNWNRGVAGCGPSGAVPGVYFPLRKGCRLTMYNDATMEEEHNTQMTLGDGLQWNPASCWDDLEAAIKQAKVMVYIVGWSVWDKLHLTRAPNCKMLENKGPSLGELLIQKAEEGVRVCMMVWDDKTSVHVGSTQAGGMMMTHDEETRQFFKGTKVHCKICKRNPDAHLSLRARIRTGNFYTHHQRSGGPEGDGGAQAGRKPKKPDFSKALKGGRFRETIGDYRRERKAAKQEASQPNGTTQSEGLKRRLIAFMGGIDLCDGRYDTPRHALFHTLNTVHAGDYHQACIAGAAENKGGPRQPWHDIHCRVEGPIAWDLYHNFMQRWRKQAGEHRRAQPLDMAKAKHNSRLYVPNNALGVASDDTGDPSTMEFNYYRNPGTWDIQLFRSIDSSSAHGLPSETDGAAKMGLTTEKFRTVDFSIQAAYVHAIRRARRFLYVENQYFLGSSHAWLEDQLTGDCIHTVPIELALKVAAKIRAKEPFACYILLPMYSEGAPETGAVQEVIAWQSRTIAMMYKLVADALRDVGAHDRVPTDYLLFFCLGNKEAEVPGEYKAPQSPPANSAFERCQKARRFQIYVHSKMLIADDEYIIIGSANINQRSMGGDRDTELAIGAYQPQQLAKGEKDGVQIPHSDIHAFRMSLWQEHTNQVGHLYQKPESLECAREMRRLAEQNWQDYVSEEVKDISSHLMNYPILVEPDGAVKALPGHEVFPDFPAAAKVLGSKIGSMPDRLTT
ncbi:hypothetical protein WJX84_006038 [Apatococcus fuscideae]|uniref:Phospholipase D n=1 Tax=Apatococcus fuscideae TaxID=2026836 RepID=A0AAW1T7Q2_9CHLO